MDNAEFLAAIEDYLVRTGMSASAFGTQAMGDANFVHDLRRGRSVKLATAARCLEFIAAEARVNPMLPLWPAPFIEVGGADPGSRPRGQMTQLTRAFPKDTNASGDIFGGWLMAQMDLAGGVPAEFRAKGRVATVAVQTMAFHQPVKVGDLLACYAEIQKVGTTSITVLVEAWVMHRRTGAEPAKATEGVFTYVAIDDNGNKRPVPPE